MNTTTKIKKPNAWVEHVKSFALKNNLSYSCALSDKKCKASYKKMVVLVLKCRLKK